MNAPSKLRALLDDLGVTPKKKRGQNFLIDPGSVRKVLTFAGVHSGDDVVEIGPGLGALTSTLIAESKSFRAIDIEEKFVEHLRRVHPELPPTTFVCGDVRNVRLESFGFSPSRRAVIISNVPYSLSSEVILWLIGQYQLISRASLLLQREFAERVGAVPGGKDYGSLSVLSTLLADVRLGPRITGSCFYPSAEVESRLVQLAMLTSPRFPVPSISRFESVVRAAFAQRRKTILNSLASAEQFGSKEEVEGWLRRVGIDPARRAETVTPLEYAELARTSV